MLGIGERSAVISTDAALVERMTVMSAFGYLADIRTSCWTRT